MDQTQGASQAAWDPGSTNADFPAALRRGRGGLGLDRCWLRPSWNRVRGRAVAQAALPADCLALARLIRASSSTSREWQTLPSTRYASST